MVGELPAMTKAVLTGSGGGESIFGTTEWWSTGWCPTLSTGCIGAAARVNDFETGAHEI